MSDLVRRLRDPAFGTETSERNLMNQAADRIEQLEAALRAAYEVYAGSEGSIAQTCAEGYQRQIITKMVGCISSALDAPA